MNTEQIDIALQSIKIHDCLTILVPHLRDADKVMKHIRSRLGNPLKMSGRHTMKYPENITIRIDSRQNPRAREGRQNIFPVDYLHGKDFHTAVIDERAEWVVNGRKMRLDSFIEDVENRKIDINNHPFIAHGMTNGKPLIPLEHVDYIGCVDLANGPDFSVEHRIDNGSKRS